MTDGSLTSWKRVYNRISVSGVGTKLSNYGFSWTPVSGVNQYEVVVHKVNPNTGEVFKDGYDVDASPWREGGVGSRAKVITDNFYIPEKNYEIGFYDVWVRGMLENGSLTYWKRVASKFEVK